MEAVSTTDKNAAAERRWKIRRTIDITARRLVEVGGISVIAAIALIFLFLLSVVYPLFGQPSLKEVGQYQLANVSDETLYLAVEEQAEIGFRVGKSGSLSFFNVENGEIVLNETLPLEADNPITSFQVVNDSTGMLAVGLQSGDMLFFQHHYDLEFTETRRIIHPDVLYPYGEETFSVAPGPVIDFGVGDNKNAITVLARTTDGNLVLQSFRKETSFIDETVTLEVDESDEINFMEPILGLLVDPEQEWAYVLSENGNLSTFDIRQKSFDQKQKVRVTKGEVKPTIIKFLTGGISLLIGDSTGTLSQWFNVRTDGDENLEFKITRIRQTQIDNSPVVSIAAEQLRKGVIAGSQAGTIKLYYTTSERNLLSLSASDSAINILAVAPRADMFIAESRNKQIQAWHIDNHHPESSFKSLWGKVWYEDYVKPDFIWQSSSASSDFEPKFSLVPLTFGTLKAAFYAMLFAMPLAICGAIFTAYFMAPKMRSIVKPSIEIMEALPTVILGFLAGLWLAPFVEMHLPGVFSVFVFLPIGIVLMALLWWNLPGKTKQLIPEGWQPVALVIPIIVIAMFCIHLSPYMEKVFFDGDIRVWLNHEMGIGFDQRNALIIGLAMGFAVIPTIFSIAEDAIFSVPKHLTSGSLALGATPWQTLVRVVLLSASPGIFSAVMIGFGRAVGETMIVLMATGNTPVMDFSIFQGMRTLSANVAVELPESEVDSTHYRMLFLAAFVLFIFTFFFNTAAEIVRQRLRKKYSSL